MPYVRSNLKKNKYWLPPNTFMSLYWHTLGYNDWKSEKNGLLGIRGIDYDGMPHGNSVGNPTERAGIRCKELDDLISEVEDTATEAGGDIAKWLLLGVTEKHITYEHLRARGIPCGKNYYHRRRHKFFYLLAKKRRLI